MKITIPSLVIFLFLSNCFSQNIWQQSNGPYSGSIINQLTVNSSGHIFASSYSAGIFRSTDNGNTWIQLNQGLPQVNFEGDRAIYIAENGDIYSSADNLGIFKSTNNGNSWFQTGMTHTIYSTIIVGNNGYVFAGTPTGGGIYRSTNGGANWTHLENGLPIYFAVITLSKAPDGKIFAGSGTGGDTCVYSSSDNGESWHAANLTQFSVQTSAVNLSGHVFVAGGYNNVYKVYRSTNSGITWELKNSGLLSCRFYSMYCSQYNEIFICSDSGLYKSVNNGDNWIRIYAGKMAYSFVKKQTGEYFLSLLRNGVYKSTNNGNAWQETSNGLTSTVSTSITVSDNGYIYSGSMFAGAFRSTNNGSNWVKIWDGKNREYVYPVFQTPNGYIFAGIDSGLYRSTNNGTNWFKVSYLQNINAYYVSSGGYIYLGVGSYLNGIYRSTDNGNNWSNLWYGNAVNSFAANSYGHIFAGTQVGVYRSINNGGNWTKVGNLDEEVYSVAVLQNGYMFAGTRHNGLFRSTDFGNNWVCIWSQFDEIRLITLNQNNHIFAIVPYAGVYRSTNMGLNWVVFNAGLFNPFIFQIALNSSGYLFAATYGNGVCKTINSTIGVKNISNEIPKEFSLSQNYPNPFNPVTKIKFAVSELSFIKLKIFDIAGNEISVLVNDELKPGIYETDWDGSNFSSGVYFYRLETNKYSKTRKMVLIK